MAKRRDKYKKLYYVLVEKEKGGEVFTRQELAIETGYEPDSMGVYFRNRLQNQLVFTSDGKHYNAKNISDLSYKDFAEFMSQKSVQHAAVATLEHRLSEKAVQAFAMAIENYNKPLASYRAEAFLILIINAWELAMKSVLVRIEGERSIYYSTEPAKTLSFRDCRKRLYGNRQSAVLSNLEMLEQLRDQAVHLIISEINSTLSRLFQATVLNFSDFLAEYGIENPIALESQGMLNLVSNRPDDDIATIKSKHGPKVAAMIDEFLSQLSETETRYQTPDFSIPIEYRFVLSKEAKPGDIEISLSKDGRPARVVQVAKDPDKSHPYRTKELLQELNRQLEDSLSLTLNRNDVLAIIHKEAVKKQKNSPDHFHMENPDTHRYSQQFADRVAKKVRQHTDYLDNCRQTYNARNRARKK